MANNPNRQNIADRPDCTQDHKNTLHPVDHIPPVPKVCIWLTPEAAVLYKDVVEKFKIAENDLKKAEVIDNKHRPLIPAINELRYCSHHLMAAISEISKDQQLEELRRAERHCERASYDSLSIALIFLIMKINDYTTRLIPKNVVMTDIIKTYPDDMALLIDSQELIAVDYKGKVEIYSAVRDHVKKLTQIQKRLVGAESAIKAAANKESRTSRFAIGGFITACLIASAGWYKAVQSENNLAQVQEKLEQIPANIIELQKEDRLKLKAQPMSK